MQTLDLQAIISILHPIELVSHQMQFLTASLENTILQPNSAVGPIPASRVIAGR